MQLIPNKMSLVRFFAKGSLASKSQDDFDAGLLAGKFLERNLDLGESNFGWAVYGNERSSNVNYTECLIGKYLVFSMRMDTLGLDSTELKMRLAERIEERKKSEETEAIGSREKSEIKAEVMNEMAGSATIKTKNIIVIMDIHHNNVFFGGTSTTALDAFDAMFNKCFDLGLQEANPMVTALNITQKHEDIREDMINKILNEPGWEYTDLGLEVHPEFEDSYEGKFGSSMLTMFFYWCETAGERCDVSIMAQDALELSGESMGAKTVTIKGGAWTRCRELGQSLKMGKRVSKMRLVFGEAGGEEELVYSVTLEKERFVLSNVEVSKEKEGPIVAMNLAVLRRVSRLAELLDEMVDSFISIRYEDEKYWEIERGNVRKWIEKF